MRTFRFLLMTLLAMTVFAGASALAQQGARRNTNVTVRQETKAENKQAKVNEAQKPTNVENQSATDARMRQAGGSQSDRRNGASSNSGNSGKVNNGSANSGNNGKVNNGGNVTLGGNAGSGGKVNNGGNAGYGGKVNNGGSHNNGGYNNNAGHNNNGNYNNGGNKPPVNNGNHNGSYGGGKYPGGYDYPGYRPALPNVRVYDRTQIVTRTNASSIVLRTYFRTKEEAYDYVAALLEDKFFIINDYGNGYSWLQTDVTFVPTPYDWTNPMTHNQFRVRVNITKSFGVVRVSLSGEWRESVLSSLFSVLRFQPSDRYSTYYAWNILEDIADEIPHSLVSYR